MLQSSETERSVVMSGGLVLGRVPWGWLLGVGLALIVLGSLALVVPLVFTLTTVTFVSLMLILGGGAHTAGAFWTRDWTSFFTHLLIGLLYLVVGFVSLEEPLQFAAGLTLMLAAFLIVGGLYRIILTLRFRFDHWGWMLANGVITLVLGIMIWRQWPFSGTWVIGTFIGIEMLFSGWTWVILGLALRRRALRHPAS